MVHLGMYSEVYHPPPFTKIIFNKNAFKLTVYRGVCPSMQTLLHSDPLYADSPPKADPLLPKADPLQKSDHPMNRHTPVKTLPSPIVRMRSVTILVTC